MTIVDCIALATVVAGLYHLFAHTGIPRAISNLILDGEANPSNVDSESQLGFREYSHKFLMSRVQAIITEYNNEIAEPNHDPMVSFDNLRRKTEVAINQYPAP